VDIQEYRTRSYPDYKREFKDMVSGPFGSVKQQILEDEIGKENIKIYNHLQQFGDWKGLQTRLPFLLEIR
jgi:protease-4